MRKTLGICVVVAVCVTSTGASAFGINDILIPAFQLGVKAVGNAASNLATSAYEAATGKSPVKRYRQSKRPSSRTPMTGWTRTAHRSIGTGSARPRRS